MKIIQILPELNSGGVERGTLEVGKLADIIAVPGNPLADISVMTDVQFVMKDGKVYRR